jgi:3,4-dihydroxy 2-butanone 4-phosphate synthase/GTP cyclohydrolase II
MSSIERVTRALEDIRAGRMVILVDDEDRENEGDLVFAAETVTPESINFMATHARGLICLAMDNAMIDKLELPMMVRNNQASLGTAFTVSIEARHGVTTGISARDRATTIRAAIADDTGPAKIVSPGTCSRCGRARAACWSAPVKPRARSTSHGWPASSPPA